MQVYWFKNLCSQQMDSIVIHLHNVTKQNKKKSVLTCKPIQRIVCSSLLILV